ncbi:TadE/TadG family type IV pilus assembly protein [Enterobacter sp. 22325]|uniref:TadE/TadG family type IV pilus assembly protein n=1 Tax=Enterobacter sp. 22325 TaxID=3453911 RepID=UPI003F863C55
MMLKSVPINSEEGIASVETAIVFFPLFLLVMLTYELLMFQSNISLIYINEEIAMERMDMALLNSNPSELQSNFVAQLNSAVSDSFLNAIAYSNVNVECYNSILNTSNNTCSSSSKLIKVSYLVERRFASKWLCDIASLPVILEREVFYVNDYYQ